MTDACHFGVPREQCHVKCGAICRPARVARMQGLAPAPQHTACGTPECCRLCPTGAAKKP